MGRIASVCLVCLVIVLYSPLTLGQEVSSSQDSNRAESVSQEDRDDNQSVSEEASSSDSSPSEDEQSNESEANAAVDGSIAGSDAVPEEGTPVPENPDSVSTSNESGVPVQAPVTQSTSNGQQEQGPTDMGIESDDKIRIHTSEFENKKMIDSETPGTGTSPPIRMRIRRGSGLAMIVMGSVWLAFGTLFTATYPACGGADDDDCAILLGFGLPHVGLGVWGLTWGIIQRVKYRKWVNKHNSGHNESTFTPRISPLSFSF